MSYDITMKRYSGTAWEIIYPKTTAENIVSGTLDAARIPSLDASKITAGTLDAARIPSLDASKITSGTIDAARIPSLDASKITAGTIDAARLPSIAVTNVVTNTTMTNFLTLYNAGDMQEGDVLILTTDKKTYIHNGGSAGDATDFTLMETPTDVVTSVAGKTGVVTLVKGDVGLGNVQNVDQTDPANITQSASYRFVSDTEKTTWNGKVDDLSDLGINVSATEINYLDNIASNVQTQLNNKQNDIIFVDDDLLSGVTPTSGDVAFTY